MGTAFRPPSPVKRSSPRAWSSSSRLPRRSRGGRGCASPTGRATAGLIETQDNTHRAAVTIWADQVHNGQELVFHKAKFLGSRQVVYRVGDLGRLAPGSRVTFRWLSD